MTKLTTEQRGRIVDLYADGRDSRDVARAFRISPGYVRRLAFMAGVRRRTPRTCPHCGRDIFAKDAKVVTNKQIAWLKANTDYEIVGAGGVSQTGELVSAADRFSWLQALAPDGTVSKVKAEPPSILVGRRKPPHQGGPLR